MLPIISGFPQWDSDPILPVMPGLEIADID